MHQIAASRFLFWPASLTLALGACLVSLEAQEISAGQTGTQKPYTISVGLREEYDDNINSASTNEQGSLKTIVSPGIVFKYPMDNTTFTFSYDFDAIYYTDRDGDSFDMNHLFGGRVSHKFNERFEIDARERFRYSAEPESSTGGVINRRLGDGFTNDVSVNGTVGWTERFSTVTGYSNTITFYDDPIIAASNEYVRHGVNQDFRLTVLPTTTAVLSYGYDTFDYETSPRDYDTHVFTVGADHYLLREWLISARAGGEYLDNSNPLLEDSLGPYASVKTVWNFLPNSSLTGSYSFSTETTDSAAFGNQQSHSFNMNVSHAWTQRFSTSIGGAFKLGTFEQDQALAPGLTSLEENTFSLQLRASYAWTNWLSTEAGYNHTTVDSDIFGREYHRNQFYLGLRGTY
ncbi:MAG: outer membrane beta-barrel protein [Blastochloris sp.]|nr:outer membrane beta-barrel protein [Blastochloris sp.]